MDAISAQLSAPADRVLAMLALRPLTAGVRQLDTMTLMTLEPITARNQTALLSLGYAESQIDDGLVEAANGEVTGRRLEFANRGVTWGYLLGLERAATARQYPQAWRLWDCLHREIASVQISIIPFVKPIAACL